MYMHTNQPYMFSIFPTVPSPYFNFKIDVPAQSLSDTCYTFPAYLFIFLLFFIFYFERHVSVLSVAAYMQ